MREGDSLGALETLVGRAVLGDAGEESEGTKQEKGV